MQTVIAPRGDARTFLTPFVGDGPEDDHYVVPRFRSMVDGDIVPVHADGIRLYLRDINLMYHFTDVQLRFPPHLVWVTAEAAWDRES